MLSVVPEDIYHSALVFDILGSIYIPVSFLSHSYSNFLKADYNKITTYSLIGKTFKNINML